MGTLKDRLRAEMTEAMRAGDKVRLGALRMLATAIVNREKEAGGHELDDDEIREVAAKEVKRRNEAMEAFAAAGRTELAEKERAEREVLAAYAPDQLDDAAIDAIVEEVIAATGASSVQDLGKVMGPVMAQVKGRADGSVVQDKVRAKLGG